MIIFITGGVMSSLGKGITASALGAQLRARGLSVRLSKFDPYLNVDPGTMSPYQHGEVFVTDDGGEVDLDFGSYERFTGVSTRKDDSTTAGKIYCEIIERERRGDYLGQTIQTIPHITDIIKRQMLLGCEDVDVKLCEIGGTVGDIEGQPFLEATRQLRQTLGPQKTLFIHLGWVPYMAAAGELKTKPLQHSVRELQRCGIQPDILVCRCDRPLPQGLKNKIGLFCNLPSDRVIEALDVDNIYDAPLQYHEAGLDAAVCAFLDKPQQAADLSAWKTISRALAQSRRKVTIAIVGKYVRFPDAYRSLLEALTHGGFPDHIQVSIKFIDAQTLEDPAHLSEDAGDFQDDRLDKGGISPGSYSTGALVETARAPVGNSQAISRMDDVPVGSCGDGGAPNQGARNNQAHLDHESSELTQQVPIPVTSSGTMCEAAGQGGQLQTPIPLQPFGQPAGGRFGQAIPAQRAQEGMSSCIDQALECALGDVDGIVVPGGFGTRGTQGMMNAIGYAQRQGIPFFGICLGMQLAVIEAVRRLPDLGQASSLEFGPTPHPVIAPLMTWMDQGQLKSYSQHMGGTMRLGSYTCQVQKGSLLERSYGQDTIHERHRHRYEVNNQYLKALESAGLRISGRHQGELVEVVERPDHPWFLATQFHPELKSRPFAPHPLFCSFIKAALARQDRRVLSAGLEAWSGKPGAA